VSLGWFQLEYHVAFVISYELEVVLFFETECNSGQLVEKRFIESLVHTIFLLGCSFYYSLRCGIAFWAAWFS
jgi:hypothetical protein